MGAISSRGLPVRGGWTLIEMIGVLAIMAVLTAVLVPGLMSEIDRRVRDAESAELVRLAAALQSGILRQRQVPGETGFVALVADELGWRPEAVRTNSRGGRRAYLIDPRLRLGPSPESVLPFHQTAAGSLEPVSPRLLLVSSLGEPLPAALGDGVVVEDAVFEAIWAAGPGMVPAGWSWTGRGEDLLIQRLQLASWFVPVVLNQSLTGPPGKFGLDETGTNVPPDRVFAAWYLRGSRLRLHAGDDALQVVEVLTGPVSYGYERGAWRGRLSFEEIAGHWSGADVEGAAATFLGSPWNVNAEGATTQPQVVHSISNYLAAYLDWAGQGFPYEPSLIGPARGAGATLGSVTADLIHHP